jgi:hypothetical protein
MTTIQPYILAHKDDDSVLRELRLSDLAANLPFMYHSTLLPANQVFFEYPDGTFRVETRTGTGNFQVLRSATPEEVIALKQEYAHLF